MKKLILVLTTSISLFSCKKKEEVKPQTTTTTQKQSIPIVICKGDTTYSYISKIPFTNCTIHETCTHVTITYHTVGKTITLQIPEKGKRVNNYSSENEWQKVVKTTNPHEIWYEVSYHMMTYVTICFGQEGAGYGITSRLKR